MDDQKVTNDMSIDDRFYLLLHKKIMKKTGFAKRRAKKYYMDQYRKTGIIAWPLLLAEKGVMEGRKCSGRPRSLDQAVRMRFIEMVKASCDPLSPGFIFITRKARTGPSKNGKKSCPVFGPVSAINLSQTCLNARQIGGCNRARRFLSAAGKVC